MKMQVKKSVSLIVLITSVITWSTPSFALRQTGLEESPKERQKLVSALLSGNPEDGVQAVSTGVAKVLAPIFAPALTGLEEWNVVVGEVAKHPVSGGQGFEVVALSEGARPLADRFGFELYGDAVLTLIRRVPPTSSPDDEPSPFFVLTDGKTKVVILDSTRGTDVLGEWTAYLGAGQRSDHLRGLPVVKTGDLKLSVTIASPPSLHPGQSLRVSVQALSEERGRSTPVVIPSEAGLEENVSMRALSGGQAFLWEGMAYNDSELFDLLVRQLDYQQENLVLVPSMTHTPDWILAALGHPINDVYAEGYPGDRYYPGLNIADEIERLAQRRWLEAAAPVYQGQTSVEQQYAVNVQAHSGSDANKAVYFSVLNPGDKVMGLNLVDGGHLTHGFRLNISGRYFDSVQFGVDPQSGAIDYDAVEREALAARPRLLIVGGTAYTKQFDWKRLREIADRVTQANVADAKDAPCLLCADVAHNYTQILAGHYPSPFGHAHFITLTPHKSGGARSGLNYTELGVYPGVNAHVKIPQKQRATTTLANLVDRAIIPGLQGGPKLTDIAAKAAQAHYFTTPKFKAYASQIGPNAKALAVALIAQDPKVKLIGDGTDVHLMLMDVRPFGLMGKQAQLALESVGLLANANSIPVDGDKEKELPPGLQQKGSLRPAGIRIGVPALTARGMKEPEMSKIAKLVVRTLQDTDPTSGKVDAAVAEEIRAEVHALTEQFPIYVEFRAMLHRIQDAVKGSAPGVKPILLTEAQIAKFHPKVTALDLKEIGGEPITRGPYSKDQLTELAGDVRKLEAELPQVPLPSGRFSIPNAVGFKVPGSEDIRWALVSEFEGAGLSELTRAASEHLLSDPSVSSVQLQVGGYIEGNVAGLMILVAPALVGLEEVQRVVAAIRESGFFGVITPDDAAEETAAQSEAAIAKAVKLGLALAKAGGIPEIAYRVRSENEWKVGEIVQRLVAQLRAEGLQVPVAVGSVSHVKQVWETYQRGGSIVVGPTFDNAVVVYAVSLNLVAIPGIRTVEEATAARTAGAQLLKVFPLDFANKAKYESAIQAPMTRAELKDYALLVKIVESSDEVLPEATPTAIRRHLQRGPGVKLQEFILPTLKGAAVLDAIRAALPGVEFVPSGGMTVADKVALAPHGAVAIALSVKDEKDAAKIAEARPRHRSYPTMLAQGVPGIVRGPSTVSERPGDFWHTPDRLFIFQVSPDSAYPGTLELYAYGPGSAGSQGRQVIRIAEGVSYEDGRPHRTLLVDGFSGLPAHETSYQDLQADVPLITDIRYDDSKEKSTLTITVNGRFPSNSPLLGSHEITVAQMGTPSGPDQTKTVTILIQREGVAPKAPDAGLEEAGAALQGILQNTFQDQGRAPRSVSFTFNVRNVGGRLRIQGMQRQDEGGYLLAIIAKTTQRSHPMKDKKGPAAMSRSKQGPPQHEVEVVFKKKDDGEVILPGKGGYEFRAVNPAAPKKATDWLPLARAQAPNNGYQVVLPLRPLALDLKEGKGVLELQIRQARAGLEEKTSYMAPVNEAEYEGPVAIVGKLGGTSMDFQAALPNGLLGERFTAETWRQGDLAEDIVNRIAELLGRLIDHYGANRVTNVYFTAPGFFDQDGTLVEEEANIPALKAGFSFGKAVAAVLAEKYVRESALGSIPVRVVHDGTGGALGEVSPLGSYPGAKDLFFVIAGTGIGTRRLIDGKPFLGDARVSFMHNEGPHALIFNNDPSNPDYEYTALLTRGRHWDTTDATLIDGSPNPFYGREKVEDLEDRTSGPNIAKYAVELVESKRFGAWGAADLVARSPNRDIKKITTRELGEAAKKGNLLARKAIEDRARELGIGLAVFIVESGRIWTEFTFPEHVIIGSGVAQIGDLFLKAVRSGFRERLVRYAQDPRSSDAVPIVKVNDWVARVELSKIEDDTAREMLAGLPTEDEIAAHAQVLNALTGLEEWLAQAKEYHGAFLREIHSVREKLQKEDAKDEFDSAAMVLGQLLNRDGTPPEKKELSLAVDRVRRVISGFLTLDTDTRHDLDWNLRNIHVLLDNSAAGLEENKQGGVRAALGGLGVKARGLASRIPVVGSRFKATPPAEPAKEAPAPAQAVVEQLPVGRITDPEGVPLTVAANFLQGEMDGAKRIQFTVPRIREWTESIQSDPKDKKSKRKGEKRFSWRGEWRTNAVENPPKSAASKVISEINDALAKAKLADEVTHVRVYRVPARQGYALTIRPVLDQTIKAYLPRLVEAAKSLGITLDPQALQGMVDELNFNGLLKEVDALLRYPGSDVDFLKRTLEPILLAVNVPATGLEEKERVLASEVGEKIMWSIQAGRVDAVIFQGGWTNDPIPASQFLDERNRRKILRENLPLVVQGSDYAFYQESNRMITISFAPADEAGLEEDAASAASSATRVIDEKTGAWELTVEELLGRYSSLKILELSLPRFKEGSSFPLNAIGFAHGLIDANTIRELDQKLRAAAGPQKLIDGLNTLITDSVKRNVPLWPMRQFGGPIQNAVKDVVSRLQSTDPAGTQYIAVRARYHAPTNSGQMVLFIPVYPAPDAGLEEVSNPFARGTVPPREVLQVERLNVLTTDLIATGVWAKGTVGAGSDHRDALDGLAQDIFTRVHRHTPSGEGTNVYLIGFEGAKHTVYNEDVEYMVHEGGTEFRFPSAVNEEFELADVTENTGAILRGQPDVSGAGGSSLIVAGPLVRAFGGVKDELGAAIIIGAVPSDRMHEFLPTQGGKPLDPDAPVVGNIERLLRASGRTWDDENEIFVMNRPRAEEEYLAPLRALQAQHSRLVVRLVKDGSYDGALLATLGRQDGVHSIIVGTVGSTEGVANYLQVLPFDDVAVGLRLYSPFAKNIGDLVRSMNKTLGDLLPEQVAEAKAKAKLTDGQYEALPKNVPIKYLFTVEFIQDLQSIRPKDAHEVTSRTGKLFHNETLTFPRSAGDPPEIRLYDHHGVIGGRVVARVSGVSWQDRIVSASTSIILSGRTLGLAGPKALGPGQYQTEHLVIERIDGKSYVWVGPGLVTWEQLSQLAGRLFAGDPPAIPATGLEESARPIIGVLPEGAHAWLGNEDYVRFSDELSHILGRINGELKRREAGMPPWRKPDGRPKGLYEEFDQKFGELLRMLGDAEAFAHNFQDWIEFGPLVRQQVLDAIRHLAQDPGAPFDQPGLSYFNPARYVYTRLRQEAVDGFTDEVVAPLVIQVQGAIQQARAKIPGFDLNNAEHKAKVIERLPPSRFRRFTSPSGKYEYEVGYDSLVEKNGEIYLNELRVLLDGEEGPRHGVILDLQVVIPQGGGKSQYQAPYPLAATDGFMLNLLDPTHFVHQRFPEWRLKDQRTAYEAMLSESVRDPTSTHMNIRWSKRQSNNHGTIRAILDVLLKLKALSFAHMVTSVGSERHYANVTGVTWLANLYYGVLMRGGLRLSATQYTELMQGSREEQALAEQLLAEPFELTIVNEVDHTRPADLTSKGYAKSLEHFLLAIDENVVPGDTTAMLQDESGYIETQQKKGGRDRLHRVGAKVAETGQIDGEILDAAYFLYVDPLEVDEQGNPVVPGAVGANWLRNIHLRASWEALGDRAVVPWGRYQAEQDYTPDGAEWTVEESAIASMLSWINTQIHGLPLGPLVPGLKIEHGPGGGDVKVERADALKLAAQAATAYGEPMPLEILKIARKAPHGYPAMIRWHVSQFGDQERGQALLARVEAAGERTQEDEAALRRFVLEQLQKIPPHIMKALKQAELQGKRLEEVDPKVAWELTAKVQQTPLDQLAAITAHATSSVAVSKLGIARKAGLVIANKSTEPQNVVSKIMEWFYLKHTDPQRADFEMARLPAPVRAVWEVAVKGGYALTDDEIRRLAELYAEMYDAAVARTGQVPDGDRFFPWFWNEQEGWSEREPGRDDPEFWSNQKPYRNMTGGQGRFMWYNRDIWLKDVMVHDKAFQTGVDKVLLFPNELEWLPPLVLQMIDAALQHFFEYYGAPSRLNSKGSADVYRQYLAQQTGLEELDGLAKEARALLRFAEERSEVPVRVAGGNATIYEHVVWPQVFLRWLDGGRQEDPYTLYAKMVDELVGQVAASQEINPATLTRTMTSVRFGGGRMDVAQAIRALPAFETSRRLQVIRSAWNGEGFPSVEEYQRLVAAAGPLGTWQSPREGAPDEEEFQPLRLTSQQAEADLAAWKRLAGLEEKVGYVVDPVVGMVLHARVDSSVPYLVVAQGQSQVDALLEAGVPASRIAALALTLEEFHSIAVRLREDQILGAYNYAGGEQEAIGHLWDYASAWLRGQEGVQVRRLQTTARTVPELLAQLQELIPASLSGAPPVTSEEVQRDLFAIGV